jgi:hypothetical protein
MRPTSEEVLLHVGAKILHVEVIVEVFRIDVMLA